MKPGKTARLLAIAGIAIVAGCGGGGGNGDASLPLPGDTATLDARTAPLVAGAVVDAVVGGANITSVGALAVPGAGTGSLTVGSAADLPPALAATAGSAVIDCAAGGTLTIDVSIAGAQGLAAGDAITFTFADCDDGDGSLVDGSFNFTVVSVIGSAATGLLRLTVAMTLSDLRFVEQGIGASMDGAITLTIDTRNPPVTLLAISSNAFSVSVGARTATLANYIVTIEVDANVGTLTLDSSAALTSTSFAGQVSYRTSESLVFGADRVPVAGQIVVTGAAGAVLTMTVVSATEVELALDADGNGTIDQVTTTTWAELAG